MARDPEHRQRAQARVGSTLNQKWHLDELLGMGGMASVYAARHRNRSRAAVKMLHPEHGLSESVRKRFLREGYVANTVDHPGVVKVLDDDLDVEGNAYLVCELLEGESLDTRWKRGGYRLLVGEVVQTLDCILDVLISAHAKGVIHRDIKPDNIFLTREGEIKLLDFGIARLTEQGLSTTTTNTNAALGTPAYMAPEQAMGEAEDIDERTDLWAVGATAFALLAGRYVHDGKTVNETLVRAATKPAEPLREVAPRVPKELAAFVDRALSFDKSERFQSAAEMLEALRALPEEMCSTDPEPALPKAAAAADTIVATGDRERSKSSADDTGATSAISADQQHTNATLLSASRTMDAVKQPRKPRKRAPLLVATIAAVFLGAGAALVLGWNNSEEGEGGEAAAARAAEVSVPATSTQAPEEKPPAVEPVVQPDPAASTPSTATSAAAGASTRPPTERQPLPAAQPRPKPPVRAALPPAQPTPNPNFAPAEPPTPPKEADPLDKQF